MRIGVIGHFGDGLTMLNGQTVKTKNLVEGITKHTNIEIIKIDSHGWVKSPFLLFNAISKAFQECDAIIMLPAQNGVQVFSPLLLHYKKKYNKKIFYDVIGGWLPEFLHNKRHLLNTLKLFDGIWVETNTMKIKLIAQGFDNVVVVPNFKELQVLTPDELVYSGGVPYRLCTFSRVMKEKGIEDAVNVVKKVNEKLGYVAYSLDIYGQVDEKQIEWFEELKKNFNSCVHYCGCVESDKSVQVLKNYFALLFPTHFFTEGIPGTIIDAYAAGVPVISAKWESYADVIDEGKTGIVYEFNNLKMLEEVLLLVLQSPGKVLNMKEDCNEKAKKYMPHITVNNIIKNVL